MNCKMPTQAKLSESSLLDAITAEQAESGRSNLCKVGQVLFKLSAGDADGLVKALNDTVFENVAIAKVLTDRGFDISDSTVSRHRRKVCKCFKSTGVAE